MGTLIGVGALGGCFLWLSRISTLEALYGDDDLDVSDATWSTSPRAEPRPARHCFFGIWAHGMPTLMFSSGDMSFRERQEMRCQLSGLIPQPVRNGLVARASGLTPVVEALDQLGELGFGRGARYEIHDNLQCIKLR